MIKDISKDPKKTFYLLAFVVLVILSLFLIKENIINKQKFTVSTKQEITNITRQSGSDKVEDIKKDLNDTQLDNLDKELDAIDRELDAAI